MRTRRCPHPYQTNRKPCLKGQLQNKKGESVNTSTYPSGLRYLFILGAIGALAAGLPSVLTPNIVIALTGLSDQTAPVIQQSGALALGFFVAGLLCWRAKDWS